MNFKPTKLKVIISIIIGAIGILGQILIRYIGQVPSILEIIKGSFIAFLIYGILAYLIWSLIQKKK